MIHQKEPLTTERITGLINKKWKMLFYHGGPRSKKTSSLCRTLHVALDRNETVVCLFPKETVYDAFVREFKQTVQRAQWNEKYFADQKSIVYQEEYLKKIREITDVETGFRDYSRLKFPGVRILILYKPERRGDLDDFDTDLRNIKVPYQILLTEDLTNWEPEELLELLEASKKGRFRLLASYDVSAAREESLRVLGNYLNGSDTVMIELCRTDLAFPFWKWSEQYIYKLCMEGHHFTSTICDYHPFEIVDSGTILQRTHWDEFKTAEAKMAVQEANRIILDGYVEPRHIVIMAKCPQQVEEIRYFVDIHGCSPLIRVDTPEYFRYQPLSDFVLFVMGVPDVSPQMLPLLLDDLTIHVALTRARQNVIFLGNMAMLRRSIYRKYQDLAIHLEGGDFQKLRPLARSIPTLHPSLRNPSYRRLDNGQQFEFFQGGPGTRKTTFLLDALKAYTYEQRRVVAIFHREQLCEAFCDHIEDRLDEVPWLTDRIAHHGEVGRMIRAKNKNGEFGNEPLFAEKLVIVMHLENDPEVFFKYLNSGNFGFSLIVAEDLSGWRQCLFDELCRLKAEVKIVGSLDTCEYNRYVLERIVQLRADKRATVRVGLQSDRPDSLLEWSRRQFYRKHTRKIRGYAVENALEVLDSWGFNHKVSRFGEFYNVGEARLVVWAVEQLVHRRGVETKDIVVMANSEKQLVTIEGFLQERDLVIATNAPETFRWSLPAPYVIYSMTCTETAEMEAFLDLNTIHVSLTRATKKVIFVGRIAKLSRNLNEPWTRLYEILSNHPQMEDDADGSLAKLRKELLKC
ncbi:unnamed protein product [Caenorhabditis sp. 36 PRJEB53466]|nr:unnamed protein product [Caenorhabditis sp. 36 PRJEB53466]